MPVPGFTTELDVALEKKCLFIEEKIQVKERSLQVLEYSGGSAQSRESSSSRATSSQGRSLAFFALGKNQLGLFSY